MQVNKDTNSLYFEIKLLCFAPSLKKKLTFSDHDKFGLDSLDSNSRGDFKKT